MQKFTDPSNKFMQNLSSLGLYQTLSRIYARNFMKIHIYPFMQSLSEKSICGLCKLMQFKLGGPRGVVFYADTGMTHRDRYPKHAQYFDPAMPRDSFDAAAM